MRRLDKRYGRQFLRGLFLLFCLTAMGFPVTQKGMAQGRGKIAGKVVEAATGLPLPGVNVLVVGTMLGATTDADGDYFIANLQPDTYSLKATFVGFRDVTVQDIAVNTDRTTEIDFEMEEQTLELQGEVVVTATRPLVEKDNTTSVVRLDATEVTTRPTTDFTNVLTTLPSIDFENGQIMVRGGALNEVAFVVDGARAQNPLDHSPYTRINLSSVQELEVITGSFNAEYGEAQSGVINVITKEGGPNYEFYLDTRFEPPGVKHWGASFYDTSSDLYWENTHARHLEWWIEYPDQWVDPEGIKGSDPRSSWTPEEAYQNYMDTHQPLTDYANTPSYQVEIGLGGPVPFLRKLGFFGTAKYQSRPPLLGNAFRDRGELTDGTLKLSYQLPGGKKLMLSGFYGNDKTGWGFYNDYFWAANYGIEGRYAYYDQAGLPTSTTFGGTLRYSHVLNASTYYELELTRVQADRRLWTLPGDPIGFDASDASRNYVRAVDAEGNPIKGAFAAYVGYHTSGYLYRYNDRNTEWNLNGTFSRQLNKFWHLQSGLNLNAYRLDHFNEAKFTRRVDDRLYDPYQGAVYTQSKFEFRGLIVNAGLRLDFYNPNDTVYTDILNPIEGEKKPTSTYFQLSPRLGVSHPIDENTVLHFSYGHFFQRPSFGDYGELADGGGGSLTTLLYEGSNVPFMLGNRNLRPPKVIAFEVGVERNFWDFFVLDLTGYYKDIRNTIRGDIAITLPDGGIYFTNGNGDYGDVRGVEISLRKVPSVFSWGSIWGYANFSTRIGITGKSGAPVAILPSGPRYGTTGDVIGHNNPRLKAGLYYATPEGSSLLGRLLGNLSMSLDYRASFPNSELRQDIFLFESEKYVRPVDQVVDMRAQKEFSLMKGKVRISPYLEVQNLFNDKWIFFGVFEGASREDQRKFVDSGFKDLPSRLADGSSILELAKYRNLPRTVLFGLTVEL